MSKKRFNSNSNIENKGKQCKFCKFYYVSLTFFGFCTPECALGFNYKVPGNYDAIYISIISSSEFPETYKPKAAPQKHPNESPSEYWGRVNKALYVHPSSTNSKILDLSLKKSRLMNNYLNNPSSNNNNNINNNIGSRKKRKIFVSKRKQIKK